MRYTLFALAALAAVQAAPIGDVTDLTSLDNLPTGSVTDLAPRQDGLTDLSSLDTLPTGSVTDLAPRQDDLADLTSVDSLPTGSVTDLAPRDEASTEDYLIQGPNYEDASADLLAGLLDPGYGGDTAVKRDDESGNVSIVDDLTNLDLSDLLNPNDVNGDSSII